MKLFFSSKNTLQRRFNPLNSVSSRRLLCSPPVTPSPEQAMIESTRLWIHKVVIRLVLCPWAAKDVQHTQIRVFTEENPDKLDVVFYKETQTNVFNFAQELALDLPDSHSGMAILPQLEDFQEFLQFTEDFIDMLRVTKLESRIQIATFHPHYLFEDTEEDDAENWTSRSPYPTIHILKVDEVSEAIKAYPGPTEKIWERNIRILRKIGAEEMERTRLEIIEEGKKPVVPASCPVSSSSSTSTTSTTSQPSSSPPAPSCPVSSTTQTSTETSTTTQSETPQPEMNKKEEK